MNRQFSLAAFAAGIIALSACGGGAGSSALQADRAVLDQGPPVATPSTLTFVQVGPSFAQNVVVTVGSGKAIPAVSSNPAVITVNPPSAKPDGSHGVKTATFTVTPVAPGTATVSIGDKGNNLVTLSVNVSVDRPLAAGDTFSYSGTQTATTTLNGKTTGPTVSPVTDVETVSTGATFNGQSNLIQIHSVTTVTTGSTVATTTQDDFDNLVAQQPAGTNLITFGFSRALNSTSPTETVASTFTNTRHLPLILDRLPETAGDTWSVNFNDINGTVDRTTTTPQFTEHTISVQSSDPSGATTATTTSTFQPVVPPGGALLTETQQLTALTANDVSTFSDLPTETLNVGAPIASAGGFLIPVTDVGGVSSLSGPALVPDWYPGGAQPPASGVVYLNMGPSAVPAACNVSATFMIGANRLNHVFTFSQPDGFIQKTVADEYVKPGIGVVCMQMTATIVANDVDTGLVFETQSTQTTLGLQSVTLFSTQRRTASTGGAAGLGIAGFGLASSFLQQTGHTRH